ncbi:Clp protease ClpP [Tenacibaculum haliotis]|uniref:Clp protease ClpP n=1 Tax=Tenacibaculum haliotis TaxID=1888914 RepID=UPI0021AEE809|nr:Clp protease ClpP [Tenacibaculum haliotis]MCT4698462.1 Clp protease ClpP [Tenacibaculum haliotis]
MIVKTHKNTLTAYGVIWDGDGAYFVSHLNKLEAEYDDIKVRIHTYGGSVFDGNLMYNALNKSTAIEKIIIDGIAASMGAVMILSRPNVEIVENGYVMIHAPLSYRDGTAADFEKDAKLLRSIEKNFKKKLMARTGMSESEVEKLMIGDNWFDAEECLAMGLVSKIIPSQVELTLPVEEPSALKKQEVFNRYAALLTQPINKSNTNNKSNMKQPLITALGLKNVNAQSSDTAVVEAVEAQLQTETQARKDAEKELETYKKGQVKAYLDTAEKNKLFDPEKREVYENIGEKSGIEALMTVLSTSKKGTAPNIVGAIKGGKEGEDEPRANWGFDQWMEKDPKGFEKMAEKEPAKYNQIFNAKYNK